MASDPWPSHQPDSIECGAGGWLIETGVLEVQTDVCNYPLLAQPLVSDIPAGSQLRVTFWWELLTAPAPAQGHLALAFDDTPVWEHFVDIPGQSDILTETFQVDRSFPKGTLLRLHLHNHGSNAWTFASLNLLSSAR